MAAPRTTAVRSLNQLAKSSGQSRQLHITGSSKHPVLAAESEKWLFGFPSTRAAPSKQWKFGFPQEATKSRATGRKPEKEESVRSFSTSDSNYGSPFTLQDLTTTDRLTILPKPTSTPFSPTSQKTRHFNTSRDLKRVGDSSTIDFAYLPTFPMPDLDAINDDVRVPLLPSAGAPARPEEMSPLVSEIIAEHAPTISTAAADGTHISSPSAMADVHDGGGHLLDFHEVAETISNAAKNVTLGIDREEQGADVKRGKGFMKRVWTGLVADVVGPKQSST